MTPTVLAKSFRMRCSAVGVVEKQTGNRGLNWLKNDKRIFYFHGSGALVGIGLEHPCK